MRPTPGYSQFPPPAGSGNRRAGGRGFPSDGGDNEACRLDHELRPLLRNEVRTSGVEADDVRGAGGEIAAVRERRPEHHDRTCAEADGRELAARLTHLLDACAGRDPVDEDEAGRLARVVERVRHRHVAAMRGPDEHIRPRDARACEQGMKLVRVALARRGRAGGS